MVRISQRLCARWRLRAYLIFTLTVGVAAVTTSASALTTPAHSSPTKPRPIAYTTNRPKPAARPPTPHKKSTHAKKHSKPAPISPGLLRIDAVENIFARTSGANVAILDTGIAPHNRALNVVNGANCLSPSKPPSDDNGHGTLNAGIIGARNTRAGVIGVAPGTTLYSVKVLDRNKVGSISTLICGVNWVTANAQSKNIRVVNMSIDAMPSTTSPLGADDGNCGYTDGDLLHQAICRAVQAGVTFVVAAGNSSPGSSPTAFETSIPAAYNEVLTVTAMAAFGAGVKKHDACDGGGSATNNEPAPFSNFATAGDLAHTVSAPGVCIRSTWAGRGQSTTEASGTSQAAAHVAGVVALCIAHGRTPGPCDALSPAQIIQKIVTESQAHATSNPSYAFPRSALFGPLVWAGTAFIP